MIAIRELAARDAPGCDAVIATLPDFFGLEDGIQACARAVRTERGVVAVSPHDDVVGFTTWVKHRPHAGEITWAAVHRDHRNRGIGRRIVHDAEARAVADGVTWMTVMTLSPNDRHADSYNATRHFWHVVGYTELRDLDVWSENLAVLMVKSLQVRSSVK
jgi:GNAT superfamily N-acetyltransferase